MDLEFDINKIKWVSGNYGLPEAYFKINIPSVTSIINSMIPDPELEDWARKIGQEKADEIMKQAGFRGTAMHLFIENFINNLFKSKDPSEALRYTQSTTPLQLLEQNIPDNKIAEGRELFYKFYYSEYSSVYNNLIKTEMGLYSPTYLYRGKADIFYINRIFGPAVTDFKTSNGYIKKGSVKELKYKYQLGGYSNCVDELYKEKNISVKHSSILCVNTKTNDLQQIELSGAELENYKNEFKTLVREYHKINNQYLYKIIK